MSEVILYIACTVDGFIARENGSIDFLHPFEQAETDYGYTDFYQNIDAVVMGANTYKQALNFPEWPHPGRDTYVFSHGSLPLQPEVHLWHDTPEALIKKLHDKKSIWLVGGSQLITSFLNAGLIHTVMISVIPIVIGKGIPLFKNIKQEIAFNNAKTVQYNDVVQLTYQITHSTINNTKS